MTRMGPELLFMSRFGVLGVAGWFGAFIANDKATGFTISALALVSLIVYRILKKHKRERTEGLWDWLDRNIVELILGVLIAPNIVNLIARIAGG